jgi:MFS family permease
VHNKEVGSGTAAPRAPRGFSCERFLVFTFTALSEAAAGDHGLLDQPPLWKVMIIVIIYLIRTALMNCTYPLNSSILMDFTPKAQRARWQSLGSIVRFGRCGSAALGGVLADQYGYSSTFLITACIQTVGTLIQFLLWPLVPRVEGNRSPPPRPLTTARRPRRPRPSRGAP